MDNYVRNKIAEVLAGSEPTNGPSRQHNEINETNWTSDKSRSYSADARDREWAQERAGSYLPTAHLAKTTLPSAVNVRQGVQHGHHEVDTRQRSPRGSIEEPHGTGSGISPRSIQHHRGTDYRDYNSPRSYIVAGRFSWLLFGISIHYIFNF